VRRNGESFEARNALVEGGEEHDDDPDAAETQPRMWSPLPVATGPKAMPMRLEVKIDPR